MKISFEPAENANWLVKAVSVVCSATVSLAVFGLLLFGASYLGILTKQFISQIMIWYH